MALESESKSKRIQIASEGFIDNIFNFFHKRAKLEDDQSERNFTDFERSDTQLKELTEVVKKYQGTKPEGTTVTMGVFARWMMIDEKVVAYNQIGPELKRIAEALKVIHSSLVPATRSSMAMIAGKIVEPVTKGETVPDASALKPMQSIPALQSLCKVRQDDGKVTPQFLGGWTLVEKVKGDTFFYDAVAATMYKTNKEKFDKLYNLPFQALSPEEITAILKEVTLVQVIAKAIADEVQSSEEKRLTKAVIDFEKAIEDYSQFPHDKQAYLDTVFQMAHSAQKQMDAVRRAGLLAGRNVAVLLHLCNRSLQSMTKT